MKKLIVKLPKPHDKQREIDNCTLKRILINAGRRGGKTTWASRKSILKAGSGHRVLYAAPVSAQTDSFWEMCTTWLGNAILLGLVIKNETKRTLTFSASGGRIEAVTAHKPDHLRGRFADYLILDEFAYQNEQVWKKVCAPMLMDSDGTAVFISTPNLRNHFYLMYLRALNNPEWAVFTFSSHDNPYLSKEAIETMAVDMTELDYKQEILAEFVPGEGTVFAITADDFYTRNGSKHDVHRIVAGLDWGQKQDFTVLSIGCATCSKELWLERTNKIDYASQRDIIQSVMEPFGDIELLAESNSIGQPNIEELEKDGVDVIGFNTSNTSKAQAVQALRLAFTQHTWKWLEDEIAWNELESFEMKITPSGLPKYGAPEGLHDDTVIARMLMLHQALSGRLQVY